MSTALPDLLRAPSRVSAPLDPGFQPLALAWRRYAAAAAADPRRIPFGIAVERPDGVASRHLDLLPPGVDDEAGYACAERLLKSLLWTAGGCRVQVAGPAALCHRLASAYAPGGTRAFDAAMMARIYDRSFAFERVAPEALPPDRDAGLRLGGHLDGCRIGFDLGASDFKVSAVIDGRPVFSAEVPWSPRDHADPEYHYAAIAGGLRQAAAHLPRVDAIGGSAAGVYVANRVRVASLFRAVPPELFRTAVQPLFLRLAREWGVPFEMLNDGDVTALAGALSLRRTALLGLAMGSSEAGGYVDRGGRFTGRLSELAFAPVDLNPDGPTDEWSGDRGVGATYFSQQAVNRLAPIAGFSFAPDLPVPERLKRVQAKMAEGDAGARRVFETIGVYLGYAIPAYAEFYDLSTVLVLGRVASGPGGDCLLETARRVLHAEFPELARRIDVIVPDETSRRVGQSVAAASLPETPRPAAARKCA